MRSTSRWCMLKLDFRREELDRREIKSFTVLADVPADAVAALRRLPHPKSVTESMTSSPSVYGCPNTKLSGLNSCPNTTTQRVVATRPWADAVLVRDYPRTLSQTAACHCISPYLGTCRGMGCSRRHRVPVTERQPARVPGQVPCRRHGGDRVQPGHIKGGGQPP